MLKIIRRTWPLEKEGEMNRLNAERADMTARDNISKGGIFILHDVTYRALTAIVKGSAVVPGRNCVQIDLNQMIGGN